MKKNLIVYYETERGKKLELDGATGIDLLTAMLLLVKEIKINTGWTNKDILAEVCHMLNISLKEI